MKKRAPIDTRGEHGNLIERRFRYCGDVEYYCGAKGHERLREKWVARNNSKRYYCGPRGEERLSEIHFPDKSIEHYHGARGRERVLYTCTEAEDDAFYSDDETPYEWQTHHRTGEENMQRERMRQAVIERRKGPLREALKTCTDPREFVCSSVPYGEVHDILVENATNALKGKIEAIRHRITGDAYAEFTDALEAYMALVR